MIGDVSPSRVVRVSLGLEAVGTPVQKACMCCMCGAELDVGCIGNKSSFSSGFTDDLSLVHRGANQYTCGDCQALGSTKGLLNSGFGAFSLQGYLPFRKWVDVAYALLNPPPAPFVMCFATAKSQHMAWRSPVNYSAEAFRVRVGLQDLHIRRKRLLEAPEICARVAAAAFENVKVKKSPGPARKTLPHPFISLTADLKDVQQGKLNPLALKLESSEVPPYAAFAQDMQWLRTLTKGEMWALRFILTPNAGSTTETTAA